ncbi:hypothetical protein [Streptomyces sp. NBC_01092]|uniref:hypothetical protein n=1 Tax=Streptomyces sp. NBC_01092 TaxID=2903748 RepID=UPI0038686116|nr:hypothetical protein OG254_43080 [Streptomyces sp. NBC_01092]
MTWLRWSVGLSGWVALAMTALPDASAVRVATTVIFLLVCPGLAATLLVTGRAFTPRAGRTGLLESVALTGAVSVAVSALVAEVLFVGQVFTPTRALLALAVLTSASVLASGLRVSKSRARAPQR